MTADAEEEERKGGEPEGVQARASLFTTRRLITSNAFGDVVSGKKVSFVRCVPTLFRAYLLRVHTRMEPISRRN